MKADLKKNELCRSSIFSKLSALAVVSLLIAALLGCERNPPTFVARDAQAPESVQIYDLMKDQNQFFEYRKGDRVARAEAMRQLKEAEERSRGVYRRQSRWDY